MIMTSASHTGFDCLQSTVIWVHRGESQAGDPVQLTVQTGQLHNTTPRQLDFLENKQAYSLHPWCKHIHSMSFLGYFLLERLSEHMGTGAHSNTNHQNNECASYRPLQGTINIIKHNPNPKRQTTMRRGNSGRDQSLFRGLFVIQTSSSVSP